MTSPFPPRRRDSRNLADLIRQDRQNLRQLGTGFAGGRNPLARPIRSAAQVDLEDDNAEVETVLFNNTDSVTVTGPGQVTFPLTFEPVAGSLQVWWGGLPQPPTEWTLNGNVVTIPDPGSRLRAGDTFTAYYAYLDEEPDVLTLDSITFRGVQTTLNPTGSAALPAATQLGDTLLVVMLSASTTDPVCSDPRLTLIDSSHMTGSASAFVFVRVYMGLASTLDPVAGAGGDSARVLAFVEAMTPTAHAATDNVATTPKAIPSVASSAALCVAAQGNSTVPGGSPSISGTGWTQVADSGTVGNFSSYAVASCLDANASSSAAGSASAGSGDKGYGFWVLTIGVDAVQT